MFTGIVEELGTVKDIQKRGSLTRLTVGAQLVWEDAKLGDSIAVNGVCLTVIEVKEKILSFEAMKETLKVSNLNYLKNGDRVNLERPLKADGRLSGHFVTGHVDGVGRIKKREKDADTASFQIEPAAKVMDYLIPKGSIAVDGISLTIVGIEENSFSVSIIPHTLKVTTLGFKTVGDLVNIEIDLLGKWVDKFISKGKLRDSITESFLRKQGFI